MLSDERPKVSVDALALFRVLRALNGPAHWIRELQATRNPEAMFPDNPINILTKDYNEQVTLHNAQIDGKKEG